MARKVVWTNPALDDLEAAMEFIARDSPAYAATLAQQVCDAGDSLTEFAPNEAIVSETQSFGRSAS